MVESTITQLKQEIKRLKKLVYLDPLTNIYNRRGFLEISAPYIQSFKENKNKFRRDSINNLGLIFLDVDDFKKINDQYGHQRGDKVLKQLAKILKQTIRKTDLLARWGGEEFITLNLNIKPPDAKKLAQKICNKIRQNKIAGINITISAGLIMLRKKDDLISAINKADKLMYQAKKQGKNQYVTSIRRN